MGYRNKKKKNVADGDSSTKTVKPEHQSLSSVATEAVTDWQELKKRDAAKREKQKADKIAANNGIAVGNIPAEMAPLWTVRFNNRFGHFAGRFLYCIILFAVLPLFVPFGWTLLRIAASELVGELFPRAVLDDTGVQGQAMLASPDNLLLRWMVPSMFMAIVLAILVGAAAIFVMRWAFRILLRVRAGLYAGYPETTMDNIRSRKATRQMRARERAHRKALKKARKETTRKHIAEAKAANPDL